MGFRFRKSFRIMPGVRISLSKSGTSLSLGGKGLTHNIGSKGSRTTVGLPGTGLSYTTKSKLMKDASIITRGDNNSSLLSVAKIVLFVFALVMILAWLDDPKSADNKAIVQNNEQKADDRKPSSDTSDIVEIPRITPDELNVTKVTNVSGFMLTETSGKSIPDLNSANSITLKSGTGVVVKGTTKNGFWHLVTEEGKTGEHYVPASNVGTFSQ